MRFLGFVLNDTMTLQMAITSIFGIGRQTSNSICMELGYSPYIRIFLLTDNEISKIRKWIDEKVISELDLKKKVDGDIKNLIKINAYRGHRHKQGLPVRGQRTKTNARTKRKKVISIA